jgi:mono/diheme cytochrome c family protein
MWWPDTNLHGSGANLLGPSLRGTIRAMGVRWLPLGLVGALTAPGAWAAPPTAEPGQRLYATHCAECHGAKGQGGKGFTRRLWGPGSDLRRFGTAGALLEYLELTMPFDDPARLSLEQKRLIARYMLWRHDGARASGTEASWDGSTPIR